MFGCFAVAAALRADVQTWTSADGRSIEAEFVRMFGSSVVVKRANGSSVNIPLSSLDEASREQAKRLAQEVKATPVKAVAAQAEAKPATTLKLSTPKASGMPTDDEIKAFLTQVKESADGDEVTELVANFSVPTLKPDEIKDLQRKKKVPYRVTIELNRSKTVDGKRRAVRLEGQGCFVVLNEAGEVVDRQREALGKLCPS